MSYRPITDMWFLARTKYKGGKKRFGGYLGGFPERARVMIGVGIDEPVLHVCGGLAKLYPYKGGFGPNDKTLDMDALVEPDFYQDARLPYPPGPWAGILMDPPYSVEDAQNYRLHSPEDARHYVPGEEAYPSPSQLVQNAIDVLPVGKKVGIIHYILPKCPKNAKFVACVGVICGFNNRIRVFSVFEKLQ